MNVSGYVQVTTELIMAKTVTSFFFKKKVYKNNFWEYSYKTQILRYSITASLKYIKKSVNIFEKLAFI